MHFYGSGIGFHRISSLHEQQIGQRCSQNVCILPLIFKSLSHETLYTNRRCVVRCSWNTVLAFKCHKNVCVRFSKQLKRAHTHFTCVDLRKMQCDKQHVGLLLKFHDLLSPNLERRDLSMRKVIVKLFTLWGSFMTCVALRRQFMFFNKCPWTLHGTVTRQSLNL